MEAISEKIRYSLSYRIRDKAAIDVAQRAGARVLVLRASKSLAKFYHCLGRSSDGRRILASAQSEFSESLSLEDKDILEFLLREHDVGDSCIEG